MPRPKRDPLAQALALLTEAEQRIEALVLRAARGQGTPAHMALSLVLQAQGWLRSLQHGWDGPGEKKG